MRYVTLMFVFFFYLENGSNSIRRLFLLLAKSQEAILGWIQEKFQLTKN